MQSSPNLKRKRRCTIYKYQRGKFRRKILTWYWNWFTLTTMNLTNTMRMLRFKRFFTVLMVLTWIELSWPQSSSLFFWQYNKIWQQHISCEWHVCILNIRGTTFDTHIPFSRWSVKLYSQPKWSRSIFYLNFIMFDFMLMYFVCQIIFCCLNAFPFAHRIYNVNCLVSA